MREHSVGTQRNGPCGETVRASRRQSQYIRYEDKGIGGHLLHLVVDGKFIGSIAYNTYFLFEVDPGTHTVAVLSINMEFVTLGTEAGQNYFLAVGARMGLVAGQSWIEPLDDEEGREAVLETSLGQELELAPKINVEESQGR